MRCPGLIRLSAGLTTQGHSISIRRRGGLSGQKCPGVQGHEDFTQDSVYAGSVSYFRVTAM